MPVFIALVLPSVSAHCTLAWHCIGHHPYSPPGQSGRSFPRFQCSLCRLVWQTGTHCLYAFSKLSGEPSTTSQSSTGTHAERIAVTWYQMLPHVVATGFLHSVEPQAPHPLGILRTTPIVLLILLTVPIVLQFTRSTLLMRLG